MKNNFINKYLISKNREKRKFLVAGILNLLLTNFFLQTLLILDLFNISISTLFSQIVNMVIGYLIYSKFIFKLKNVRNINFVKKYLMLMIFLWLINAFGIKAGSYLGISTSFSALILIPILAILSFLGQKFWVFK